VTLNAETGGNEDHRDSDGKQHDLSVRAAARFDQ
jgi:hypothetical protein